MRRVKPNFKRDPQETDTSQPRAQKKAHLPQKGFLNSKGLFGLKKVHFVLKNIIGADRGILGSKNESVACNGIWKKL